MKLLFVALLALLGLASAIYGPDHWKHATALDDSNFDSFIAEHVDAGKTVMVRFIASEGWGWWRKQAPSWNKQIELYAGNKDIVFGDVNLSTGRPSSKNAGSPGKGGWPTLRHYNKETGPQGEQYNQKTSKDPCDEMKEDSYMETYIMEAAQTSRCEATTGNNCSDKEKEYIKKYQEKGSDEVSSQYSRLVDMGKTQGSKQSIGGFKWLAQRTAILKQLHPSGSSDL